MLTGGKRMERLLQSGKVDFNRGGQILDTYNQRVYNNITPTIMTTIDSSSNTFVTTMNKQVIHTAPNGAKYSLEIR